MSLPKSTTYLKDKKKAIPIHMPFHIYRALTILGQELGTSISDQVTIAIVNWLARPKNRKLLKQTKYSDVSPVDKIFV